MKRAARAAVLTGVVLALALPAPAHAQARAPAGDEAAAEALFAEGRAAMERGDHRVACEKLDASHRLDPAVGTLLNLADCREALGDLAAAWQHLRAAVAELEPNDERLAFTRQRLAGIERRVPTLLVRLDPGAPPGARVRRDGVDLPAGSLGSSLPLNPGEHVVEVEAPGFGARRYAVVLAEGERRELSVGPGARAAGADTPAPGDRAGDRAGSAQRTWGWIALGAGALGAGAGVITGVVALNASAALDAGCAAENAAGERACPAAMQGDLDTFRLTRTLSYVGFGLGALGLGAGVTLLITAPDAPAGARRDAAPGLARVEVRIAPGFAGLRGVF